MNTLKTLGLAGLVLIAGCSKSTEPKREEYRNNGSITINGNDINVFRDETGAIQILRPADSMGRAWCFYSEGNKERCGSVHNYSLDETANTAIENAIEANNNAHFNLNRLQWDQKGKYAANKEAKQ